MAEENTPNFSWRPTDKNLKKWKKGESGNPNGSRERNKDLMVIRRLTQSEVADIGSMVVTNNLTQLKAVKDDKDASVLKVWFAAVALKGIVHGDANALAVILDRIVGKPKEIDPEVQTILDMRQMSTTELLDIVKKNLPEAKEALGDTGRVEPEVHESSGAGGRHSAEDQSTE